MNSPPPEPVMKDRAHKDKLKPTVTLSRSKRSKKQGSSGDGACSSSTTPITWFFGSRAPAQLACPLCGLMVPRFKVNEHIDFQCQNFERSLSASPDATGALQGARRSPEMVQHPEELQEQTSPYFKKSQFKEEREEKSVVRVLDLGSLSSRLSRTRQKIPETSRKEEQHHEKAPSCESLDSSQKENLLQGLEGTEDCATSVDVPATGAEEMQPGSATAQHLHHKAPGREEQPAGQNQNQNPSSSLVKRKVVFPPKATGPPKRAKRDGQKEPSSTSTSGCSGSGVEAEEAGEDAPGAGGAGGSPADQEARFGHPSRLPYYLQNFRSVLGAVLENEDDRALFDHHDMSHVEAFEKLSGRTPPSFLFDLGGGRGGDRK